MKPVLEIGDYTLDYEIPGGTLRALNRVSLEIAHGEVVGLVGESGSGKTSMAWSIMRYLPRNAREVGGTIRLSGLDLLKATPKTISSIRGSRVGMVFQDPSTSLNPTLPLGQQVAEVLVRHRRMGWPEAFEATVELLDRLDLKNARAMAERYPHEVSGGEKQRVVIAAAFACRPDFIIFDEPTSALDVVNGARLLDLFTRLREETGVAGLYISHDLRLVSRIADRVVVLKHGNIVEEADSHAIFNHPKTDYARQLIDAVPDASHRLVQGAAPRERLLAANDIHVQYGRKRLFSSGLKVVGTQAVSLSIKGNEILGIVGESGSGKSTLARALTGLTSFKGSIDFGGRRIVSPRQMDRKYRSAVQIIFQNPDSSLNPRQRIADILARPLRLYGGDLKEIPSILEQVQLPPSYGARYPHELSGGEKQRIAIARAFAAKPALVICDEVTSALDVSVQALIVRLLLDLRKRHGTSYLFITHDLHLVRQIADRVGVMHNGELVDLLPYDRLDDKDVHPYTRELLAATPSMRKY